jgi:beta propeller repeat protein
MVMGTTHDKRGLILVVLVCSYITMGCGRGGRTRDDSGVDLTDPLDVYDTVLDPDGPVDIPEVNPTLDDAGTDEQDVEVGEDCFTALDPGFEPDLSGFTPDPPGWDPTPCPGCCRQITFWGSSLTPGEMRIEYFDVWGAFAVYRTISHTSPVYRTQIRLVDLEHGDEYVMDEGSYDSDTDEGTGVQSPAIHGSQVMYVRYIDYSIDDRAYEVVLASLAGDEPRVVHSGTYLPGGWGPLDVKMYGDHAVWQQNHTSLPGMQEIHVLDIPTGDVSIISEGGCCVADPDIWGTKVVYTYATSYMGSGYYDILMYDIETGLTSRITEDLFDQWDPEIWEDVVVWVDARNGGDSGTRTNADIYMYDIGTGVTRQVTTNPYTQMGDLDVYGDMIVWEDLRDDPLYPDDWMRSTESNIYGYRISTSTESRVTSMPGSEGYARVFGDRVFYCKRDSINILSMFMVQR